MCLAVSSALGRCVLAGDPCLALKVEPKPSAPKGRDDQVKPNCCFRMGCVVEVSICGVEAKAPRSD